MSRSPGSDTGLHFFAGAFGALCCVGTSDNEGRESAFLANAGTMGCGLAGTNGGFTDVPAVRGFTRSDNVHEAAYRVAGTSDIKQSTGTPFGGPVAVASGALANSNAWGYKRHDGPNTILYLDVNGHPHEVGSADIDFSISFGINAPAGSPSDIIGYVRSDNKSGWSIGAATNTSSKSRATSLARHPGWRTTSRRSRARL